MRTIRAPPVNSEKKMDNTKKMELRMSHANQMVTCTALPTLGRNQSMFDCKGACDEMDELELSMTDFPDMPATNLDLLNDEDEDDDYDDYHSHMNLTAAANPPSTLSLLLNNLSEKSQLSTTSQRSSVTAGSDMLMDDYSSRSQGSASSTRSSGSSIQDFVQARISTFTRNMDTIAEIVAEQFEENTSASRSNNNNK